MQIVVKGKNLSVSDSLREYAEKRITKMTRHHDGLISAEVTLSTERNWHIVEVTVHASGFMLRGEERSNDMYASIDLVLDKLEKQLSKHKGKWDRKSRTQKQVELDFFQVEYPRGEEEAYENEELVLEEPRVARLPMVTNKPMTVEEAMKEMQALDFSFLVFINEKTDVMNVLYRRKRGFGLIDPSLETAEE